jgi:hypothetical protein
MEKPRKHSPTELPMFFQIAPKPLGEELTALGGVPLVMRAFWSLGLPAAIQEHVHIKQRERGYSEATYVEGLVVLNAVGGECVEDLERLREDAALSKLPGHDFPSPRAALEFLYQFHDEPKIEEAKRRCAPDDNAYIPEESVELQGPGRVNHSLVQELGSRCAGQRIATVDQDATIIESRKQEALPAYEGERGYQPMLAVWAEMDVVLADQFRDGNVPAMMEPLTVAKAAYAAVARDVADRYNAAFFQADTGTYGDRADQQTAMVLPFALGIAPEDRGGLVLARLIDPIHARNDHVGVGFAGPPFLLGTPTEVRRADLANRMVNRHDYPSWATLMHDGVLSEDWHEGGTQMPSCGGPVSMWLYQSVPGTRPDPAGPGFRKFILAPQPDVPTGLMSARGSYQPVHGTIESEWTYSDG